MYIIVCIYLLELFLYRFLQLKLMYEGMEILDGCFQGGNNLAALGNKTFLLALRIDVVNAMVELPPENIPQLLPKAPRRLFTLLATRCFTVSIAHPKTSPLHLDTDSGGDAVALGLGL